MKEIEFKIGEYMLKYRAKMGWIRVIKFVKTRRKKKYIDNSALTLPPLFIVDFRIKIDKELIMIIKKYWADIWINESLFILIN